MKVFFIFSKLGNRGHGLRGTPLLALGSPDALRSRSRRSTPTLVELSLLSARHLSNSSTTKTKRTHYQVLGVTRSATNKDIREAFLKLSKQCHPDTNTNDPSNHKKFVQVNEAYSVLSKPLLRSDYDLTLNADGYVSRQMNATYYRSHGFEYPPHDGPYYHRGYSYEESSWTRDEYQQTHGEKLQLLGNFYVLTVCITLGTVALILYYMNNFIPNSRSQLRKLDKNEIEKHELIMMSEDKGVTYYYYAVPTENDPKSYEVLAVQRKPVHNTDEHELHEVTRLGVFGSRNGKTDIANMNRK